MNTRGWKWINEDSPEPDNINVIQPLIVELVNQWSALYSAAEQRGWARQAAFENPGECDEPDFDSDEEAEEFHKSQCEYLQRQDIKLELIETQLAHLGARMMRPYEHHNEDERLMEYMERER
jgi:hypothetical protein